MTYKDFVNLGVQKLGKENKSVIQKFLKIPKVAQALEINHLASGKYEKFLKEIVLDVPIPSKVTKTKDGKAYFKQIESDGRVEELRNKYIAHQQDKSDFSKRITAYMMDFLATPKEKEEDLWQ